MNDDRHERGARVRREVMGEAYVKRAEVSATELDADFQRFVADTAWGEVWSREGLTRRERSLITIALLAALGHDEILAAHVRATRRTGASPEDVREALFHVAVYAGVPAANRAFAVARRAFAESAGAGDGAEGGAEE